MEAISGSGGERLVAIGQIDASDGDGENDGSKAQRKKAQIDASNGDGDERKKD